MHCQICGEKAWYVDGRNGRPVCPQHARIEIVSRLSFGSSDTLSIHGATLSDFEKIEGLIHHFGNSAKVTQFGKEYDIMQFPAYVVRVNDHISGVLSYAVETEAVIVLLMGVLPGYQGLGAGRMLVDQVKAKSVEVGRAQVLASTSNDDLSSVYFYQRNGFRIYEVKPDLTVERRGGLEVGFGGIPRRDEIRLRWTAPL